MSAPAKYQPYNPAAAAPRPTHVSQATAIEQSRAIAEVQAAVVVAQSCPRDMAAAESEMEYVCGRLDMAEQAFYQVTNRGTGMSVHLARELARIWGNVDYGVKELHRSDEVGESEVQAFSWDIQKNTRSSRTFIVPHQRMVKVNGVQQRKDLVDLQDIYLNNQNIGARAVRETITTILPRWFTEKAQNICRNTLENGEGEPLQDRIAAMVAWFTDKFGITEKQIEARLEKKRGQWDAGDVAQMKIAGGSIQRGEAQKDELFPPIADQGAVSTDELAPAPAEDEKPKRARKTRSAKAEAEAARAAVTDEQRAEVQAEADKTGAEVFDVVSETALPQSEVVITSVEGTTGEDLPGTSADPTPDDVPPKSGMRKALEKRLFTLLGDIEPTLSRDDRIDLYRGVLRQPEIGSTNDLDDVALAKVCDQLYQWGQAGQLNEEITDVLMAVDAATEGTQDE